MKQAGFKERANRFGWLVVLGACLLAGLPGCFFSSAVMSPPRKAGVLGSPEGLYLGADRSITVLAELDDHTTRENVGVYLSGESVERLMQKQHAEADSELQVSLYAVSFSNPSYPLRVIRSGDDGTPIRSTIEREVGSGQWLEYVAAPNESGYVLESSARLGGEPIDLTIAVDPGKHVWRHPVSDAIRVVLLPGAIVLDVISAPVVIPYVVWALSYPAGRPSSGD
ncbi:hypothetical protein [Algisphaera agarilytica]|uniref:Uncharacterized protein n=1 Tax=Algisphaera agarilytica TaxID=1385975 RepID=A0A7X0LKD3_9BACT|nr:hypothetical protein [Algisphaera agarilytica]MBB6430305.1 hypothetical protein [Algisphaera agarilytica]